MYFPGADPERDDPRLPRIPETTPERTPERPAPTPDNEPPLPERAPTTNREFPRERQTPPRRAVTLRQTPNRQTGARNLRTGTLRVEHDASHQQPIRLEGTTTGWPPTRRFASEDTLLDDTSFRVASTAERVVVDESLPKVIATVKIEGLESTVTKTPRRNARLPSATSEPLSDLVPRPTARTHRDRKPDAADPCAGDPTSAGGHHRTAVARVRRLTAERHVGTLKTGTDVVPADDAGDGVQRHTRRRRRRPRQRVRQYAGQSPGRTTDNAGTKRRRRVGTACNEQVVNRKRSGSASPKTMRNSQNEGSNTT